MLANRTSLTDTNINHVMRSVNHPVDRECKISLPLFFFGSPVRKAMCPSVLVSLLQPLVTLELRFALEPVGEGEVRTWLVGSRLEGSTDCAVKASGATSLPPISEEFEAAAWPSSEKES